MCASSPCRTKPRTRRCPSAGSRACSKAASPATWPEPRWIGSGIAEQRPDARMSGNLTYRVPTQAAARLPCERTASDQPGHVARWVDVPDADVAQRRPHGGRAVPCAWPHPSRCETRTSTSAARSAGTDQRYALDLDVKSDSVDVDRLLGARREARPRTRPSEGGPKSIRCHGISRSRARCGWPSSRCVTRPTTSSR